MLRKLLDLENWLGWFERGVNIGLNQKANEQTRHGVLWAVVDVRGEKRHLRVPIVLNKPELVYHGLNRATWARLKLQITRLGVTATHIELKFEDAHYCYSLEEYKELYSAGNGSASFIPAIA